MDHPATPSLPIAPVTRSGLPDLAGGRYRVVGVLGRGGFGTTYEGLDLRLQRRVAIKELLPERAAEARERFLREARVLARFSHPGVVRVFEVFEEHGTAYLVMERLHGRTLVEVMAARGRPFDEDEVLDVAGRVGGALRPVHAAGVLHRDLNPSNVMITEHGRIVLIDFGLARDFEPDRTVGMTRLVTPGYAPPEQYGGVARFGPATDVYGLAATLYRLATGAIPPSAVERAQGAALVPVHRANPAISKAVADGILDGLELDPGHRPADLDAFLARVGVRHLPEGTRSVLAGSPGAEASALRAPGPSTRDLIADAAPSAAAHVAERAPSPSAPLPADPTVPTVVIDGVPGPPARTRPGDLAPPEDPTVPGNAVAESEDRTIGVPSAPPTQMGSARSHPLAPERPIGGASRPPGRAKLTIPAAAAVVGVALAVPVAAIALLVLVVLPALATIGDGAARRLRADVDLDPSWAERRIPGSLLSVVRFFRNLGVSVLRSSPILGIAAVFLGGWYVLAGTSLPTSVTDALLRIVGVATVGALLASSAHGSARFRTGLGIDVLVARAVPEGRTTLGLVVGWILAVAVVAAGLWLHPDAFPLR